MEIPWVDCAAEGAGNGEGVGVGSLAVMLPSILRNTDGVLPLLTLDIVEEEDGSVPANVGGVEKGGDTGP